MNGKEQGVKRQGINDDHHVAIAARPENCVTSNCRTGSSQGAGDLIRKFL